MKVKVLKSVTIIDRPLPEVFEFFSNAGNLNRLTPINLKFEILSKQPIEMKKGQLIDYRIFLFGIPFNWKTEIGEWKPMSLFTDRQISGPYKIWDHQHLFESIGNQTKMTDIVHYQSKGWIFAPFIHWLFVDRKVKEIFAYRENKLNEIFSRNKIN